MTRRSSEAPKPILLVTRNFPPLRGGMERLNERMLAGLSGFWPVALAGPQGCALHAPAGCDVEEVPASPLWRFLPGVLLGALRLARRHRPRVVLAGSGLTAPMAWLAARLVGARSAVYLHGLDLVVPNRIYQILWLPFIRRCDILIANSSNTARLACERGIDEQRLHVIPPGTDLPGLDPGARQRFRSEMGLGNRPTLLSVGRLTRRKGLVEFVREGLPAILARRPDTVMVVFGHDAIDALVAGADGISQRERLLDAARDARMEHALRLMPPCDDATLSDAYHAADVHVFPVLDVPGDVEGFGMVAIESAARGLPTVGFRVGGVPDAIVDGGTGSLAAAGDYVGFAMHVLKWLDVGEDARRKCAVDARRFGWHRFDQQLRALLDRSPECAAT